MIAAPRPRGQRRRDTEVEVLEIDALPRERDGRWLVGPTEQMEAR